jgi:hypothetical protein
VPPAMGPHTAAPYVHGSVAFQPCFSHSDTASCTTWLVSGTTLPPPAYILDTRETSFTSAGSCEREAASCARSKRGCAAALFGVRTACQRLKQASSTAPWPTVLDGLQLRTASPTPSTTTITQNTLTARPRDFMVTRKSCRSGSRQSSADRNMCGLRASGAA